MGISAGPARRKASAGGSPKTPTPTNGTSLGSYPGPAPSNDGAMGRPPTPRAVKLALLDDVDLWADFVTDVEQAFWEAVSERRFPPHNPDGWLAVVSRRIARRLARPRAKALLCTLEPTCAGEQLERIADDGPLPDEQVADREERERLEAILPRLRPRDLAALAAWADGIPSETQAALAGARAGTVRVRAFRAIRTLRRVMSR